MPNNTLAAAGLIPALDGIPGPWWLMAVLLFALFVIHLLLVNAVLGVALIGFCHKVARLCGAHKGSGEEEFTPDLLLPKGLALVVNFGIPPFLFLQCIFGQYIYSSSVLMAVWWLSLMLLVMLAYYGLYINMVRRGLGKTTRLAALGIACALLLACAFIFVNNVTLMQSPATWSAYGSQGGGNFLNSADPQLVPRYIHILLASLAVGGLVLAFPAERSIRKGEGDTALFCWRRGYGLRWFFYATLAQLPVGVWFLLSLPTAQRALFIGGDPLATALFATALLLAAGTLAAVLKNKTYYAFWGALAVIPLMLGMRTLLRASMLAPYYNPNMRAPDTAPLVLFFVSLALSAVAVAWLVRVYSRHRLFPAGGHAAPDGATPETLRQLDKDTRLIIEICQEQKEDEPDRQKTAGRKGEQA